MSDWKYVDRCWNCQKRFEGGPDKIKLFRDYYDENYFALVCPDCGAHATIPHGGLPEGYWWDDNKKCLNPPS